MTDTTASDPQAAGGSGSGGVSGTGSAGQGLADSGETQGLKPFVVYEPGMAPGYSHFGGEAHVPGNASGFPDGFGSARHSFKQFEAPAPAPDPAAAGVGAVRARDPHFDLQVVLNDAERTYFVVEKAWTDRNPDVSTVVMSPEMWSVQRATIAQMVTNHQVEAMQELTINQVQALDVQAGPDTDWVKVRFSVGGISEVKDDRNGAHVAGDGSFRSWTEDWTFSRPAGSQSDRTESPTTCPQCGAPISTDLSGRCSYCHCVVAGTDHQWRLARIERPTVYNS